MWREAGDRAVTERLLTPSKITSWLGCAHSLTLSNEVESGLLRLAPSTLNDLAEVLIERAHFTK